MEQTTVVNISESQALEQVRSELRGTVGWVKFLGVVTLIGGILTALGLVGVLNIVLGIIMLNAANRGKDYTDRNDLSGLVEYNNKLKVYFIIHGVLAILALAGAFIAILILIITLIVSGFAIFQQGIRLF